MPRALWKGAISFGLVTIPVGLYTAEKSDDLDLDLLDRRDLSPIGYRKVNKSSGREVPPKEIAKGYEVSDGKYVLVDEADIKAANVRATQTVDIESFVRFDELPPLALDKPYFLAPQKAGAKAYALLREALARSDYAGIARVVIRTRQYVAALYPHDKALVLNLLRYAHEVRDPGELDLPGSASQLRLSEAELKLAERLIDGMVQPWDWKRYRDEYRDDLLARIRAKAKGGAAKEVKEPPERPKEAKVVDLMALLKQSVEEGGRRPAKRAPARAARAPRRAAAAHRRSA